jgi:hypothetical protein
MKQTHYSIPTTKVAPNPRLAITMPTHQVPAAASTRPAAPLCASMPAIIVIAGLVTWTWMPERTLVADGAYEAAGKEHRLMIRFRSVHTRG